MVTKKDRRHSGYVTPRATISKKDMTKYNLFINDFYDDWVDYRDGFRDWFRDFKQIKKVFPRQTNYLREEVIEKRIKMNLKQKKLLKRRKAMKLRRCEK